MDFDWVPRRLVDLQVGEKVLVPGGADLVQNGFLTLLENIHQVPSVVQALRHLEVHQAVVSARVVGLIAVSRLLHGSRHGHFFHEIYLLLVL